MNERRRELFFQVMSGDARLAPVLYEFDRFVHCERMLEWLVKNKITGNTFFEYYSKMFKCSWLSFGKWIVMKINKDREMKPIIAGKDYLVR